MHAIAADVCAAKSPLAGADESLGARERCLDNVEAVVLTSKEATRDYLGRGTGVDQQEELRLRLGWRTSAETLTAGRTTSAAVLEVGGRGLAVAGHVDVGEGGQLV